MVLHNDAVGEGGGRGCQVEAQLEAASYARRGEEGGGGRRLREEQNRGGPFMRTVPRETLQLYRSLVSESII